MLAVFRVEASVHWLQLAVYRCLYPDTAKHRTCSCSVLRITNGVSYTVETLHTVCGVSECHIVHSPGVWHAMADLRDTTRKHSVVAVFRVEVSVH